MLLAQTTADGSMPQYYFEKFSTGRIKMKTGQLQTANLNYNTVTERMVFIKDEKYYDLTNISMIDTVIIQHIAFIPVGNTYYEVLVADSTALLLQHKGEILPAGKPVGYGGTSQLASAVRLSSVELSGGRYNLPIPSDFIVNISPVYWIRENGEMLSFTNERQFLNLFSSKADRLKDFIKKNRIKMDRKEHVIKLVNYYISIK